MILKNDPRVVRSWCLYDWANSVYSLTIISAIFPIYFQAVAVNSSGGEVISFLGFSVINSVLYSYALSFSFLLVVLLIPVLSGIADYTGKKKAFLVFFMLLGSFSCMGMYFFTKDTISLGIFLSVAASVGFSSSLVFYNAYLPAIVSEDMTDRVSGRGFSYGYIGGVILLVINLATIELWQVLGFSDQGLATRFAFLTVGLWWLCFGIIAIKGLPGGVFKAQKKGHLLKNGFNELISVAKQIRKLPSLKWYLWAFLLYNTGVQTVMYLAASFGSKELNLSASKLILTVLIIQFLGVGGASLFARISERFGNLFSLTSMNILWVLACVGAYFTHTDIHFYILASVVGLIMGGIQALSRATYSKLIPENTTDHTSFFSFYDVTFNVSIVIGTFTYGLIEQITGNMRFSAISMGLFFIGGIIVLTKVKQKNVRSPIASLSKA